MIFNYIIYIYIYMYIPVHMVLLKAAGGTTFNYCVERMEDDVYRDANITSLCIYYNVLF